MKERKNISVVTAAPFVQNYGSICLTYATQELFKEYGYDVEILNYSRQSFQEAQNFKEVVSSLQKRDGSKNYPKLVLLVFACFLYPSIKKMAKHTNEFFEEYINVSKVRYLDEKALLDRPPVADIYCTGGDQMWNEQCNFHKTLKEFYLSYAPTGKPRISFSTSIGKQRFDEWELPEIMPLLKAYDYISVREEETVSYFEELGIENVKHLLDPTLLLSKAKWNELAQPRLIKDEYILMYEISRIGDLREYAKELAKRTGKRLIRITRYWFHNLQGGKSYYCPTPEQWLSLFKYADCIITNSFHGVVFSTVFERPFIVVSGANPMRIASMLAYLGITGRICKDRDSIEKIYHARIDYSKVDKRLSVAREQLSQYMDDVNTLLLNGDQL